MIEGNRLKMQLNPHLASLLRRLADSNRITPEEQVRELISEAGGELSPKADELLRQGREDFKAGRGVPLDGLGGSERAQNAPVGSPAPQGSSRCPVCGSTDAAHLANYRGRL